MQPVQFRPDSHDFVAVKPYSLDEVIVTDAVTVHAELMADDSVWIGIDRADGSRVAIRIGIVSRTVKASGLDYRKGQRRKVLQMIADLEPSKNAG